ncbi:bacillithiol biosynthesis cysteine-adding enzyme BshC [Sinomicrobium soli]|uniref:bacillithiol biosynthesis cysteine-adding enzyme BshC n=1 Tax=Sinomicrobium sp. N-1-3-6 TaxID=2219864 RepID=UPI000DCD2943|nr:bacillithiol biosynthesis cysteine-adding enzyme BshC [Sinomicrobium sp. N-1-3-6]RAV27511.1 bacillithiol biosynthesis cysteine-adding enzyme BshC [Sinomicrobium sp. N-1-3-6]
MPSECISLRETGYFSGLICDYVEKKERLSPFYHRFPEPAALGEQMKEKQSFYSPEARKILGEVLKRQYEGTEVSAATRSNMEALTAPGTFTVTTGHQLNLFTGPSYFLYKIVSAVKLAARLNETYPEKKVVPVYWMATEDHDFEEISHFYFNGKNFNWNRPSGGAVGRFSTDGLEEVFQLFSAELGPGTHADELRELFREAYLGRDNLAQATRFLVNRLFGHYGLVIVDGDDKLLKERFVPYMEGELLEHTAYDQVSHTSEKLREAGYGIQVNPREINLFYLGEDFRERIEKDGDGYTVHGTDISWGRDALLKHLREAPERFSPNVLMRPLYQEVVLPNLCYIGGGGEIAYWLQMKDFFNAVKVPFPVLLVRNSVLVISAREREKMERLHLQPASLFMERDAFINRKVREISDIDIDFTPQKTHLRQQFKGLYALAERTDKSFENAVKAQEVKQLEGLEKLEKRLLKAQRRKLSDHVVRITGLQDELFPGRSLQERTVNFSWFYREYGSGFIAVLMEVLEPLEGGFTILTMKE